MATQKQLAALRKARLVWQRMSPKRRAGAMARGRARAIRKVPTGYGPTKKPYRPGRFRRKPGPPRPPRPPRPKPPDYNAMWKRKKDVFALNRAKVNYERRLAMWKRYRKRRF